MTNKTNRTDGPTSSAISPDVASERSSRVSTSAEYRAVKLRVQRETTRVVKRTLLAIALLAGLYYCFLVATRRADEPTPPVESESPTVSASPAAPSASNERLPE